MKTIRNVTMLVPVLITSCQVSENPNSGPVTAQTTMTPSATMNAHGVPVACDTAAANFRNASCTDQLPSLAETTPPASSMKRASLLVAGGYGFVTVSSRPRVGARGHGRRHAHHH